MIRTLLVSNTDIPTTNMQVTSALWLLFIWHWYSPSFSTEALDIERKRSKAPTEYGGDSWISVRVMLGLSMNHVMDWTTPVGGGGHANIGLASPPEKTLTEKGIKN